MTNLDELDEKICKLRLLNEQREIELNKLEAYYWLKTTFNINAEDIKTIRYKEYGNTSTIELKSDSDKALDVLLNKQRQAQLYAQSRENNPDLYKITLIYIKQP